MKNIEDFLTDPEFIRWVNHPDKELGDYWNKWRKANPEQLQAMKVAKEILYRSRFERIKPPQGMKEDVIGSVLRLKYNKIANEDSINTAKRKLGWAELCWNGFGQMGRVAAILVVSFGLVCLFLLPETDRIKEVAIESETIIQKATSAGEKMQLTLGDGTKVWLNSSSQVEFPEKFRKDQRSISLKGEAYFEVVHDSLRPFTVSTDGMLTIVLGTSFNIKAKESGRTQIALVSGKVEVATSRKTVTMSPGDLVDFDENKTEYFVRKFDVSEVLAWKDGVLRFKNASLEKVRSALEQWYGVDISFENESRAKKWQFSGEYNQQTLEEVILSMSYIQKFDYQINDKSVTFIF
jgi:transmembrane sensor